MVSASKRFGVSATVSVGRGRSPTLPDVSLVWILVPVAYVVGMFPSAQLVGRLTGHDPTQEGSGNPGASNTYRVAGARAGVFVLLGDLLKGAVPTLAGLALDGRELALAAGAAAVIGHVLPATRRFRGGKGVATVGGVCLVLYTFVSLGLIAVFFAVVGLTKKAAVGSLAMVALMPVGVALRGNDPWEIAAMAALAAFVFVRHWNNIKRLVLRREHALRAQG